MGIRETFDVFISHSYVDRELAGQIKSELSDFDVRAFVAHDDIDPSVQWQDAIMRALRECDTFIALLTHNFESSNWTDQETGYALALGKKIIPIKIDINPYGFISRFQALKWKQDMPWVSIEELNGTLIGLGIISKQNLISWFSRSYSFDEGSRRSSILLRAAPFNKEEIDDIVVVAIKNNQIYGSWDAKRSLEALVKAHEKLVDSELWTQLSSLFD